MGETVVIIGSGLGGLATGAILAKNGYNVTVVEQHSQIGGCLQCFTRGGVKFETGMHFIGSCSEGQTLQQLMRYLEIDNDVQLSQLDTDGYDIISLAGKEYKIANGREAFIDSLCEHFPDQRANLNRYYDLIEEIANASSLHSLNYTDSARVINPEYLLRSINDVISEIITDETLCHVLAGNLPLYAAEWDKTPFSTHAFIVDFYNKSAYRVIGGSDRIASSLAATITRYGGQVRTRAKAVQIHCESDRAIGVELSTGEMIACDYVVSDAHPKRTLEMITSRMIRPAFRKRIEAIPQTVGGFSLYLKFKPNSVPYLNSNYYAYRDSSPWNCEHYDEQSWPKGYLYMHMCHEAGAKYAQSGVVLSYMNIAELEPWRDTTIGKRGATYEAFKRAKAERLLDELEQSFPNLRDGIESYYTATPLSYRDYTSTEDGSMYGVAKDISKSAEYRVACRLRVPNVFQTGQNINSHGMLGVMVGAIITCSEFIATEALFKQIRSV